LEVRGTGSPTPVIGLFLWPSIRELGESSVFEDVYLGLQADNSMSMLADSLNMMLFYFFYGLCLILFLGLRLRFFEKEREKHSRSNFPAFPMMKVIAFAKSHSCCTRIA